MSLPILLLVEGEGTNPSSERRPQLPKQSRSGQDMRETMGKFIFVLGFLFLFVAHPPVSYGSASDVWVTQAGAGSRDGSSLENAASIVFIQSSSNCGSGSKQIGPGTTIHLSGNFTYPVGTNAAIVPACSGAAGNPVVITTDPGTRPVVISSPKFSYGNSSTPCCAISLHGLSYVTVDGGVPCGTITGAVDSPNACGLVIEDTASGTAYDAVTTGGMNDQSGLMDAGGVRGIEVKGVAMLNSYVHLPPWQISSVSFSGSTGTITCPAACPVGRGKYLVVIGNAAVPSTTVLTTTVNNSGGSTIAVSGGPSSGSASGGWAIDVWGTSHSQNNFFAFSISGTSPGLLVHDSVLAHGGWLAQLQNAVGEPTFQFYNNQIYDFDHGLESSACPNGGCGAGAAIPGPIIHDNHFHDSYNWDDYFNPANRNDASTGPSQGPNNNHHDGVHLIRDQSQTNENYFTSAVEYNNRFDGDYGVDFNNALYLEASSMNEVAFNNVFACSTPRRIGGYIAPGKPAGTNFTTNFQALNNTVVCAGGPHNNGGAASGMIGTTTGNVDQNNIWQGPQYVFGVVNTGTAWATGGLDYNIYENVAIDGGLGAHALYVLDTSDDLVATYDTLATWRSYLARCACSPMAESSAPSGSQGQDLHSYIATDATINLTSVGQPRSGSPAITNGTNLSSLCTGTLTALCADIAGNPRPATGPWDIGAYYVSGGTLPNPPAAPTGLTAVVD